MGSLQVMLDKGQEEDWFASHWIAALALIAVVGLAVFIWHELRVKNPVVHLRVFKIRTFSAGVFLMTSLGFVLYGSLVLLPILLQTLMGYPALEAGVAMAPRGLGSFLMMPIVGMIMSRFDPRKLLAIGMVGAAVSLFQLSWLDLDAGYWNIFWPQFLQGAAMAFVFVPLTTATMDAIPKEEMGNATSIFNVMRNIGGSVGIASASTFLFRREQLHINILGAHVDAQNPAARAMLEGLRSSFAGAGGNPSQALQQSYGAIWGMVQRQAAMQAFVDTFWAFGLVFLLVLPLLLVMKRPRHRASDSGAH
jgi:DHA2 family multidrug resistance protein